MAIESIAAGDVAKITSGQVITELVSVVKELVDNALDAGSTKIEVTFHGHGAESVEVADNGHGIAPHDLDSLCRRHHTSKIARFEDLASVSTLGFRGEAMSSLCAVAQVAVTTCSKETFPRATQLSYDKMGVAASRKSSVSGKQGTTVSVGSLFAGFPVRQKNFVKHIKREYSKALAVLMAYALVYTEVRFTVFNVGAQRKKSMVLGTQGGSASVADAMVNVFGSNGNYGLVPVDISVASIEARFRLDMLSVPTSLALGLRGYISESSFGMGRAAADRQYLSINRRPVTHKRLAKTINEVYKNFNSTQCPVFVLDMTLDTALLDVNVTPDKRLVMMQCEDLLCEVVREELTAFYETRHHVVPRSRVGVIDMSQGATEERRPADALALQSQNVRSSGHSELSKSRNTFSGRDIQREDIKSSPNSDREEGQESQEAQAESAEEDHVEKSQESDDTPDAQSPRPSRSQTEAGRVKESYKDSSEIPHSDNGESQNLQAAHSSPFPSEHNHQLSDEDVQASASATTRFTQKTDFPERRVTSETTETKDSQNKRPGQKHENGQATVASKSRASLSDTSTSSSMHETPGREIRRKSFDLGDGDSISAGPPPHLARGSPDAEVGTAHGTAVAAEAGGFFVEDTFEDLDGDNLEFEIERKAETADASEPCTPHRPSPATVGRGLQAVHRGSEKRDGLQGLRSVIAVHTHHLRQSYAPHTGDGKTLAEVHDLRDAMEIRKLDFREMEIVGQFNHGFIIVAHGPRLFIVDQHALDEIYNYERLMRTLVLRAQPLVVPRVLELSPVDEMVLLQHTDQLRRNGFVVSEMAAGVPGQRVRLTAVPVLKNVVFDDGDLHELMHKLHEHGATQVGRVRCSKVDKMIALRACRLSIMIGQSLARPTMAEVVQHLATLERPWNCPHGRPTMRHLADFQGTGFDRDYAL